MSTKQELIRLRAEMDALIATLPDDDSGSTQPVAAAPRFMKLSAFASSRNFSSRTIRDYCDLGMPHQGEGRARRILVAEADAWIDAGGPRKARASRKGKAA